jgi:hypothetical protein
MDSPAPEASPAGILANLPRTLVSTNTASFRSERLTRPETNRVVIVQTRRARGVPCIFLIAAAVALWFAVDSAINLAQVISPAESASNARPWIFSLADGFMALAGTLIPGVVGLGFAAIAIALLTGWIGPQPTVFDLQQEVIRNRGRESDPLLRAGLPLKAVAAIQICTDLVVSKDSDGARTSQPSWEMNLVLRSPPGHRIHLMEHGNEPALRDDARQLAELLGVPLLDHTKKSAECGTRSAE